MLLNFSSTGNSLDQIIPLHSLSQFILTKDIYLLVEETYEFETKSSVLYFIWTRRPHLSFIN